MKKMNCLLSFTILVAYGFVWLATADLQAQVSVPFRITGSGVAPTGVPLPGQPERTHWAVGQATHLGRYSGEGSLRTFPNGTFESVDPFVFVAANGDKLVCYYGRTDFGAKQPGTFTLNILDTLPGDLLLVEAEFIAEFVVQPDLSTGRFAGATGSWVMYAYTLPFILGSDDPIDYWWDGNGQIQLRRGR